jgi:hypothetical protein
MNVWIDNESEYKHKKKYESSIFISLLVYLCLITHWHSGPYAIYQ